MYATDFEFDGKRLSDFGYVIASFDGEGDGAAMSGANISLSTSSSLGNERFDLFNVTYGEPYSITFTIMRNPCAYSDQEDMYLSPLEISTLQRWLCRKNHYCKFKIDQNEYENIYWMGTFTSQQYVMNGHIIGLELTFTADSSYGHIDNITLDYNVSANGNFTITDISEEEGYIYPDLVIKLNSAGNLAITNSRDTKVTQINNCSANEIITIDGDHLTIKSSLSTHDLGKDFNFIFPRIINTYEDVINTFNSNLACSLKVTYAPAIKTGI